MVKREKTGSGLINGKFLREMLLWVAVQGTYK